MKPKPFSALKNFTVPMVNLFSSHDRVRHRGGPERHPTSSAAGSGDSESLEAVTGGRWSRRDGDRRTDRVGNEGLRKLRRQAVLSAPTGAVGWHDDVRGELAQRRDGRLDDRFE